MNGWTAQVRGKAKQIHVTFCIWDVVSSDLFLYIHLHIDQKQHRINGIGDKNLEEQGFEPWASRKRQSNAKRALYP